MNCFNGYKYDKSTVPMANNISIEIEIVERDKIWFQICFLVWDEIRRITLFIGKRNISKRKMIHRLFNTLNRLT